MAHEIFTNLGDFCYTVKGEAGTWHNLELAVDDIAAALKENAYFCSPIICEPYLIRGEDGELKNSDNYRAVLRQIDRRELGSVGVAKDNGKHWTPLQNLDLLQLVEPMLEEIGVHLEAAISIRGGAIVALTLAIQDQEADITNGDHVRRRMLFSNGHTGGNAARIGFTDIRSICSNTYHAAINSATSKLIRVNHSSEIKMNMEKIRDVMDISKSEFLASCEQLRELSKKKINAADLRRYVKTYLKLDPEEQVKSTRSNNIIDRILTCVSESPGSQFAPGSWYQAAHGINFYENHVVGKAENRLYNVLFKNSGESAFDLAFSMAS